jgi:FkbM family methyltransferase
MVINDLIFDFGMHKGFDAEFYLTKGFRVVGLEAVPSLAQEAAIRLERYSAALSVVNRALHDEPNIEVIFYTNPEKDDWGSLDLGIAEKLLYKAVPIVVPTVTLAEIFDKFGVPRYLKCDLEGGDLIFLRSLLKDTRRPKYISVELNDGTEIDSLLAAGYEVGQFVNQWLNPFVTPPNPSREGGHVDIKFHAETSGLFGLELDPKRWRPLEKMLPYYRMWRELKNRESQLGVGWIDLHVAKRIDLPNGAEIQ